MSEFVPTIEIGSVLSIISQAQLRYVGSLVDFSEKEEAITLKNVKCLGSENRFSKSPTPSSSKIYDLIKFSAEDIDRITLCDEKDMLNSSFKIINCSEFETNYLKKHEESKSNDITHRVDVNYGKKQDISKIRSIQQKVEVNYAQKQGISKSSSIPHKVEDNYTKKQDKSKSRTIPQKMKVNYAQKQDISMSKNISHKNDNNKNSTLKAAIIHSPSNQKQKEEKVINGCGTPSKKLEITITDVSKSTFKNVKVEPNIEDLMEEFNKISFNKEICEDDNEQVNDSFDPSQSFYDDLSYETRQNTSRGISTNNRGRRGRKGESRGSTSRGNLFYARSRGFGSRESSFHSGSRNSTGSDFVPPRGGKARSQINHDNGNL